MNLYGSYSFHRLDASYQMVLIQISLAYSFDFYIAQLNIILPRFWLRHVWYSPTMCTYVLYLLPLVLQVTARFTHHPDVYRATFFAMASLELAVSLAMNVSSVVKHLCRLYTYARILVNGIGLPAFIEMHWLRIRVPTVFRVFWFSRAVLYFAFNTSVVLQDVDSSWLGDLGRQTVDILVHGCDTTVALIGMACVISTISHYIGQLIMFLAGCQREDGDREIGTMSAILFTILALQSGLTSMDSVHRPTRLFRNYCLLMIAMLHFIHVSIDQHLLALCTGGNAAFVKHVKAVGVSLTLACLSVVVCVVLLTQNPMGTWLFALTVFTAELVVKTIITLLVYALFRIDAHREDMWEELDDYVYRIRSTGSTVEFIFGMLLFGNGSWILLFESGGVLRAAMMCIHAYFNIWKQGWDGWNVFIKRRTAVQKIGMLPEASAEELEEYANVCAICYQELYFARVTKCRHMFHGVCLRKWLYAQDRCPLCQQSIYSGEAATVQRNVGVVEEVHDDAPLPIANDAALLPIAHDAAPSLTEHDAARSSTRQRTATTSTTSTTT